MANEKFYRCDRQFPNFVTAAVVFSMEYAMTVAVLVAEHFNSL